MFKRRLLITLYGIFILTYLGFMLYFLSIRPGGSNGSITIMWTLTAFASGGMLMMAIYAIALYSFQPGKEKAALYLALICTACSCRFFVMESSQTIIGLIPGFSFTVMLFIRYICIGLTIIGVTGFIYELFAKPRHKKLFIFFISLMLICTISVAISVLLNGDGIRVRIVMLIISLVGNVYLVLLVARSPDLHKDKLNKFYLVVLILYVLTSVVNAFSFGRLPHTPIISNTMMAIAHIILLADRYARAVNEKESAKREAQELAAKTDFYRKMSHSLRTPLTVVSTNIQTAQRRPNEAEELLKDSQSEIMKMAEIISDALKDGDKGAGEE